MKIFTEVNYQIKNGKLEQVSSESFDYFGPLTQCGGGGGNPVKAVKKVVKKVKEKVVDPVVEKVVDPVVEKVVDPVVKTAKDVTKETVKNVETGVKTGVKSTQGAIRGINTSMTDAGSAITTGIEKGTSNVAFAMDKTVGKAGLFVAKKMGDLMSKEKGEEAEQTTQTERGQSAGERFKTMGQGGQGGMKSASMATVKKATAGAGGKRRLRKINKSGATV